MPKKKPSKSSGPTFPLQLTQQQRNAIVNAPRMRRKFVNRLKDLAAGPQIVQYTRKDWHELNEAVCEAAIYAYESEKPPLLAVVKKIDSLLDAIEDKPARGRPADDKDLLLQFKITLLNTHPPIWRRIQLEDGTLADLHDCIQAAMGWDDYHLHQFQIGGVRYGPTPPDEMVFELEDEDESLAHLSDLVPRSGRQVRWIYNYDFGDDWYHEILFEGYPVKEKGQKYPLCLEGARACPPEDCGGPWGYAELLEALANPNHERHEDFMEWCGPIDPTAFDAKQATKAMRRA